MQHTAQDSVLLLTTGLSFGGAEAQLVQLAIRLQALGWKVAVASLLPPQGMREPLDAAGIPVHSLGMRRGIADPRAVLRLARLIRTVRPSVVHAHMVHANLLARVARLVAPIPRLICTAHSVNEGSRARELAYRLTDALADVTTSICRAGVERYTKVGAVPPGRMHCVLNGVDLRRYAPDASVRTRVREALHVNEQEFLWLHVGRMDPVKQHDLLLDAVEQWPDGTAGRLYLVGDGPLAPAVRARLEAPRLRDRVTMLGLRKDVPELLAAADGLVLSSKWEGLPMVLLEAAAAGVPCVVPDVGGCAEVVQHGQTGIVVAPQNATALSAGMHTVMELPPSELAAWASASRARAARAFDLDAIVDVWDSVYRGRLPVEAHH